MGVSLAGIRTRKELKVLNEKAKHSIYNVSLEGTAYTASKMARGTMKDYQQLGRLKYNRVEDDLNLQLELYGVKVEAFRGRENLLLAKSKLSDEIIQWVISQSRKMELNMLNDETVLWLTINFEDGKIVIEAR